MSMCCCYTTFVKFSFFSHLVGVAQFRLPQIPWCQFLWYCIFEIELCCCYSVWRVHPCFRGFFRDSVLFILGFEIRNPAQNSLVPSRWHCSLRNQDQQHTYCIISGDWVVLKTWHQRTQFLERLWGSKAPLKDPTYLMWFYLCRTLTNVRSSDCGEDPFIAGSFSDTNDHQVVVGLLNSDIFQHSEGPISVSLQSPSDHFDQFPIAKPVLFFLRFCSFFV